MSNRLHIVFKVLARKGGPAHFCVKNSGKMGRKMMMVMFFLLLLLPWFAEAQCAMCRAVLESGGNQDTAEGINNGIVYLMAIPYVLVGALFYFVYKKLKA